MLVKVNAPVVVTPIVRKKRRNFFLALTWSAIAPRTGARMATTKLAAAVAKASLDDVIALLSPWDQNCLKYIGKKAAIILVAKVEFAQS